tara:strand:+ start:8704 stop:9366 length:663 start_codon:yes stop_codon:yes gene_type:complete
MLEFGREYEVLVFDDASTDNTLEVIEPYRSVLPIHVIRGKDRMGYGILVERLLREALRRTRYPKRDAAVVIQGDFTDDPEHIVALVKALEGGADLVAGNVTRNGADVPYSIKITQMIAPIILGKAYSRAPVSDPFCGFRAYRLIVFKKVIEGNPSGSLLSKNRWTANFKLLKFMTPHARRITEIPMSINYGIRKRPSRFRVFRTLRSLLGVRKENWENIS